MEFLSYLNNLDNYETEEPSEPINDGMEVYFPPEILYEIFQNLSVQGLGRAALVNKLWNETATRVLSKRGPQIALIPLPNYNVYDLLRVKPYVTFMFMAPEIELGTNALKEKVIEKYKHRIPYNFVTLGVSRLMIDEVLITANDHLLAGKILGLLIPEYRDLNIRVVYTQDLNRRLIAKNFLDKLLPEDSKSKVTFIMFNWAPFGSSEFFETMKESIEKRQQKYSLWGTSVDEPIFARANNYIDNNTAKIDNESSIGDILEMTQCDDIEHKMFAISITGSSLESWAIVINCSTKKREFHTKLLDFRNQLRFKRCTIGLVAGPQKLYDKSHRGLFDVHMDYREMMHAVKTVFPDITLIGIYNDVGIVHGLKSKADDPNQTLQHWLCVSVMILTYD